MIFNVTFLLFKLQKVIFELNFNKERLNKHICFQGDITHMQCKMVM